MFNIHCNTLYYCCPALSATDIRVRINRPTYREVALKHQEPGRMA